MTIDATEHATGRPAIDGGLESCNATKVRGDADRTTNVGAKAERRLSGCDGCSFTARGAARTSTEVPWVFGGSIDAVIAFLYEQKLRNVGFAQDDAAGRFERSDSNRIFLTVMTASTGDAERGRGTDDLEVVFDRHRQAVERSDWITSSASGIGRFSRFAGTVIERQDDGTDLVTDCAAPVDERVDDLDRRCLAFGERSEERRGI